MGSTVTRLCDNLSRDVPAELRKWRVTEDEIGEALALLGRDHAAQNPVEQAEMGDSLLCRDGAGRTVPLYPGRRLPGAEQAERAALGRKTGETFLCRLGETEVSLTVEKILRLEPHPVNEALVKLADIPGVGTLAEYRAWYVRETEPKKREAAAKKLTYHLWNTLLERSQISVDHGEQERWCGIRGREIYESMVKSGQDPHIPDEGTELLSDEEALAKIVLEQEPYFRQYILSRHISRQDGFEYTREMFVKDVDNFHALFRERLEAEGYDFENAYSDGAFLMRMADAYADHAFTLLAGAAEKYLED